MLTVGTSMLWPRSLSANSAIESRSCRATARISSGIRRYKLPAALTIFPQNSNFPRPKAVAEFQPPQAYSVDPNTVRPAVYLHKHIEPNAACPAASSNASYVAASSVSKFSLTPLLKYPDRLIKLSPLDRRRVSNIRKSIRRKRLRLGKRRNRDRAIMPFGLQTPDLNTLMRLNMRPQPNIVSARHLAHLPRVSANPRDFQQSDGVFRLFEFHSAYRFLCLMVCLMSKPFTLDPVPIIHGIDYFLLNEYIGKVHR